MGGYTNFRADCIVDYLEYQMKYLIPTGGAWTNSFYGVFTQPHKYGISSGISSGMPWAADNGAFNGFKPDEFFPWLDKFLPYRSTCLFVVCPDMVGNARETLRLFDQYHPMLNGWPVAFVAQDGQEILPFPDASLWSTLFIGGTTEWKVSPKSIECIKRAQTLEKHIHIGRVNYHARYKYFANLPGGREFTCDGTRIRFERDRAIRAWKQYMDINRRQLRLNLPGGDNHG